MKKREEEILAGVVFFLLLVGAGVAVYFLVFHHPSGSSVASATMGRPTHDVTQVVNTNPAAPPPAGMNLADGNYILNDSADNTSKSAPNGMIVQIKNGAFKYNEDIVGSFLNVDNKFSMVLAGRAGTVVLPMTSWMEFSDSKVTPVRKITLGVYQNTLPTRRCPINYSPATGDYCVFQNYRPDDGYSNQQQIGSDQITLSACQTLCNNNSECQTAQWYGKTAGKGDCIMFPLANGVLSEGAARPGHHTLVMAKTVPVTIPPGAAMPVPFSTIQSDNPYV